MNLNLIIKKNNHLNFKVKRCYICNISKLGTTTRMSINRRKGQGWHKYTETTDNTNMDRS